MKLVSKATAQRLRYAGGYLALGLLTDASDELELIEGDDRLSNEVLILRSDLYMQAKQWDLLEAMARELTQRDPNHEKGWIDRAYALREMERVPEAKGEQVGATITDRTSIASVGSGPPGWASPVGQRPLNRYPNQNRTVTFRSYWTGIT